jgi:hypothetical protein
MKLPIILDKYYVLPNGDIYNVATLKLLKPTYSKSRSGRKYYQAHLFQNNKRHHYYVHRLVAYFYCNDGMFHLECKNEVNHIDCNTSNNSFENLEIITASENQQHWRKLKEQRINDACKN